MHKKHPHLAHPKYRPDIDGLRAVAILAVVVFHAFPQWIPGGFIGVDIFFVISGFLISSIIFSSLERDRFSLSEFYTRRIRRIFPALLVLLVACLVFGWFVLLADEYKQLGRHTYGGAGFISNLVLWRESGYFDNTAATKPLLHLWSLAIEEQFYIFWPLLLAFVWRRGWNFLRITAVIGVISLAVSVYLVGSNTTLAYYSPLSRFWELMIGGTLAYIVLHRPELNRNFANTKSLLGAVLLAAGLWTISKTDPFPGFNALLPTLGAFFLISAGPQAWLNRYLLSNRVFVWIGLISYPLYLWHWPLLSFGRIIKGEEMSDTMRIAAVASAVVLAWLTYRLVEQPLRFGPHSRHKTVLLFVLMLIIGVLGYSVAKSGGVKSRSVVEANALITSGDAGYDGGVTIKQCGIVREQDRELIAGCREDSREEPAYALLGDSKAGAIFGGLVRTSLPNGRWLLIGDNGPHGAPVPVLSDAPVYAKYQPLTRIAVHTIAENPHIRSVAIVAAARALFQLRGMANIEDLPASRLYDSAFEGLRNTVEMLIASGKKVVLVVDNPTLSDPRDCILRVTSLPFINQFLDTGIAHGCSISVQRHLQLSAQYHRLLAEVAKLHPDRIRVFDTLAYLCDEQEGMCLPTKGGRLMYSFSDHISDYAAGLIGADLNRMLADF